MATAKEIESALIDAGFRQYVDAIEDNHATPGEVVLWAGSGTPVYSVAEAIEFARERKTIEESRDWDSEYDED